MEQLIPAGATLARETYNNPGVVLLTYANECVFDATEVVNAALAVDPERVIKPISGRLKYGGADKILIREEHLWSHVIDDTHTYAGWYGAQAPQTWDLARPWESRDRLITIGEFGAEALDAYETMRDHYPAHHKPPPADADALWGHKQVQKHDMRQVYGLGRKPGNLGEYIEASQKWQESAVADQAIGFRLSPRAISGYFQFHFIDAVPAFWPKSIVSHDHKPKKTFYQMAQINQPVVALPQLTGKKPDAMIPWVANDLPQALGDCTVEWCVRAGQQVLKGQQRFQVPALDAVPGEPIDLKPVTDAAEVFELELVLMNPDGETISRYVREVRSVPEQLLKK